MQKIRLGNYPTPIQHLERLSHHTKRPIYIKRDDYSGVELSGNKTRKLEFALAEAQSLGCTRVITAGALQSNHARATAAACRKLGLDVHLALFGQELLEDQVADSRYGGNYFLDHLLEATITYIDPSSSHYSRYLDHLKDIQSNYAKDGIKAYIIPIGASNGIGNLGYVSCYEEILQDEKSLGQSFDTIVCTVGSGGTYAGLWLGNYLFGGHKRIVGISISAEASYFKERIIEILTESAKYIDHLKSIRPDFDLEHMLLNAQHSIEIIDGYQGAGYAIPYDQSLKCIKRIGAMEGVLFDPVYTGKAMYGLISELEKGHMPGTSPILFIHTGGIFGTFAFQNLAHFTTL